MYNDKHGYFWRYVKVPFWIHEHTCTYMYMHCTYTRCVQGGVPIGAHHCVSLGDEAQHGHVPLDGEDPTHPAGTP